MKTALPALALAALTLAGCASLQPPAVRPGPSDEPPIVARSTGPKGTPAASSAPTWACR
jgi:flagellar L-ring protein precursor FlgH